MSYTYAPVVYVDPETEGGDYDEVLHLLNREGPESAIDLLAQWDHPRLEPDLEDIRVVYEPKDLAEVIFDRAHISHETGYVLVVNTAMQYAILYSKVETE